MTAPKPNEIYQLYDDGRYFNMLKESLGLASKRKDSRRLAKEGSLRSP